MSSGSEPLVVIIQPMGREVDVLEAPLHRYRPDIAVLITNMEGSVELAEAHLRNRWRNVTRHDVEVIKKIIGEPWRADTIEEYMLAFNEAVEEISRRHQGREIKWHVGTAGGTNLMSIASGMSAFTHRFPAYYSQPPQKHPELAEEPAKLLVEIPLLMNTGPAHKCLQKKRSRQILEAILEHNSETGLGVQQKELAYKLDSSAQNISTGMKCLKITDLVSKEEEGLVVTTLGKMMLAML